MSLPNDSVALTFLARVQHNKDNNEVCKLNFIDYTIIITTQMLNDPKVKSHTLTIEILQF